MSHLYHLRESRKIFLGNYLCIGFVPGGMHFVADTDTDLIFVADADTAVPSSFEKGRIADRIVSELLSIL